MCPHARVQELANLNPQRESNPSLNSTVKLKQEPNSRGLFQSKTIRVTSPSGYYVVVQLACHRYGHILILKLSTCPHSPTGKDKLEDALHYSSKPSPTRMSHTALILPVYSRQSRLSSQPYPVSSPRRAYPSPRASAKRQANELNNLVTDDSADSLSFFL
ncbi:hypothetical protein V8E54_004467 [Elaphomyces granulatus]